MPTLYIVATPIGNREDMTLRAIRVLKEVSLIAAEDTRTARKLLDHFQIRTPVLSFFEHNQQARLDRVLAALTTGDVALISEAGMPGISDPGAVLIAAAIERGIAVVPIPGPSALTAALAVAGLPTDRVLYLGFLPRRAKDRRQLLSDVAGRPETLVCFEAPHRLQTALADMAAAFGPQRRLAVCRELTKLFEEVWRGTLAEARAHLIAPRGEFTLVIAGATEASRTPVAVELPDPLLRMTDLIVQGMTPTAAARQAGRETGHDRRDLYRRWLEMRGCHGEAETQRS